MRNNFLLSTFYVDDYSENKMYFPENNAYLLTCMLTFHNKTIEDNTIFNETITYV